MENDNLTPLLTSVSVLLPEAEFTLNAIAESELNKYLKKKTRTMIWFAICIMAGNVAHLRTIKGVNDVANNLSSGPVKATKSEFGDMVVGMPTLIVMGTFAVLFMLAAIFFLSLTYSEVIKNNRDTKKWQKINGYIEVLVVLTFSKRRKCSAKFSCITALHYDYDL